jgi:aryl-alcohol dehydrogenase-like predicted oxidoreductase
MHRKISIDRLVLGTLHLRRLKMKKVFDLLDYYFCSGGKSLDTAYLYGHGEVEHLIGEYVRAFNPGCHITTKVGYFNDSKIYVDFIKLRSKIFEAIDRLNCIPEYILLHEADWSTWWYSDAQPGELATDAILEKGNFDLFFKCLELGKEYGFRVGISGNHAPVLQRLASILHPSLILVAKQYDLLWNSALSLINQAENSNYLVLCAAPFHQGWLYKLNELKNKLPHLSHRIMALNKLLHKNNLKVEQLAISYILSSTNSSTKVVFGVESLEELKIVFKNYNYKILDQIINEIKMLGSDHVPMQGPIAI